MRPATTTCIAHCIIYYVCCGYYIICYNVMEHRTSPVGGRGSFWERLQFRDRKFKSLNESFGGCRQNNCRNSHKLHLLLFASGKMDFLDLFI